MKFSFYPKLAADGMRKNKGLYIPYLLTCIGMVMMHYIIAFLEYSDTVSLMPGADTIKICMMLGSRVIAVFACLFLFYTNSFLMKRRKKEFGLYSVLGMNRKNISNVLFFENIIIFIGTSFIGIVLGIVFSKLAEAGLVKIIGGEASYSMSISFKSIIITVVSFAVIFILLFFNSVRQIRFTDTVSLLKSENKGEKAPKANLLLGIAGVVILAVAYYVAVTIYDPLSAITVFFSDVLAVILATYLLFISGSVLICKLLQNSKKYYYNKKHFVSVSSMTYRMKRNGAGLASICILATMVLVMISSSVSLYTGTEDSLKSRYPREVNIELSLNDAEAMRADNISALRNYINAEAADKKCATTNVTDFCSVMVATLIDGENIRTNPETLNGYSADMVKQSDQILLIYFAPISDYNRNTGKNITLNDNECIISSIRKKISVDKLVFENGESLIINNVVSDFDPNGDMTMDVMPSAVLFVNDVPDTMKKTGFLAEKDGERQVSFRWSYSFDTDAAEDKQIELSRSLAEKLASEEAKERFSYVRRTVESRAENRNDFYGTYGSVFLIGIMLSTVFIAAAVLIIYYKQISEGFEDAERFAIMKKVGMTEREIKKSINSQLLTVFSLPLLAAGMHLAFAFPIIGKLLNLFNLYNNKLFAVTSIVCFVIFSVIYAIVYKITSNSYYRIVSGTKNE